MTTLQVIELFWAECYCQEHDFKFLVPSDFAQTSTHLIKADPLPF